MPLRQHRRAVGVFPSRREAEDALHELRDSGFPMDRISVVARDADRDDDIAGAGVSDSVGNKADEGARAGALAGGTLGGITGLLVGLGALAIPGIGPIMLAGATATAIATTLSGAGIGAAAGSLLGALAGLGIPEERARVYNERVTRGEYLVIVDGTDEEIARAQTILQRRGIQEYGIYDRPDGVDRDVTPGVAAAPLGYAAATTPTNETAGRTLGRRMRAIGVFPSRREATAALTDLRDSGFDMDDVSVIAKHADRDDELAGADMSDRVGTKTGSKADEGAKAGAATGGALGGLGGLLVGLGTLAIPGVGPILAGGAAATALTTALAGGAIGAAAGGLTGGLVGLGIPDERARFYNDRVARGDYLVIVDGTEEEVRRAQAILTRYGIQDWDVYDAPGVDTTRNDRNVVDRDVTPGIAAAPLGYAATPTRDAGRTVGRRMRAIGVFPYRRDAEAALIDLRDSGFDMNDVSVIAKDADRDDELAGADMSNRVGTKTGSKADEGAKAGAATGGALGGLGGLLVGLGTLAIPGVGPILAGGAAATALTTALAGGAMGAAAGGLAGGLVGLGIPDEQARIYDDRVARGYYLVIVDGTEDEVRRAEGILNRHGIQDIGIYDAPGIDTTRSDRNAVDRDNVPEAAVAPVGYAAPPTREATGRTVGKMRAVGVFPDHRYAESALNELRDSGFNMDNVSVIAKHADRNDEIAGADVSNRVGTQAGTKADEGAKTGAATGGALGGLGGLLVGLGTLAIPGVGPILAGGAAATALTTALAGGAIGAAAGGLTGGLVGLGIPEERAKFYNDRVNRGNYLVFVDGTEDEIRRAQAILSRRGIQDWNIYDAPGVDTNRTSYDRVDTDITPGAGTVRGDAQVISNHPDVVIIDRRDETP